MRFHHSFWFGLALWVVSGCAPKHLVSPHQSIVGCEYYFDHRGIRGYYWMQGPPHMGLWIKACYSLNGQPIKF